MIANRMIFVVDDDPDVRRSVCALLGSMSCPAQPFGTAEEFLAHCAQGQRGIIVADLRMPGMCGLELQQEILRRNLRMPIVFLSGHARTAITVQAMQSGAVTMIDKPYHDDELWNAVRAALAREEADWLAAKQREEIGCRLATLTPDERLVMQKLVEGKPNKTIAKELGLAVRTVEKRRHEVLAKMQAGSIAELVGLVRDAQTHDR